MQKNVLTIAGSDPSGGAGIQADLKTFTAIGVYAGAVVTCHTVQNTTGVQSYQPADPDLLRKQIAAVLQDINVSHIKIGMIGPLAIAEAINEGLRDFSGEVIWDPVVKASSGQLLTDVPQLLSAPESLFEKITVITPNLPEIAQLAGQQEVADELNLRQAAAALLQRYDNIRALLVKGGHGKIEEQTVTDFLFRRPPGNRPAPACELEMVPCPHPYVQTRNDHGTGCTFASAFTAYHLLTGDDVIAFTQASAFMHRLIVASAASDIGHGRGPLLHHLLRTGL
jgi:hydroxymethylpyrimidine/phosphomethylpyrimidine kinase